MILHLLLLKVAFLGACMVWFSSSKKARMTWDIPYLAPVPLLGAALVVASRSPPDLLKLLEEQLRDKSDKIKLWIGTRLLVFLTDPRDVEVILGSNTHLEKSPEYDHFKPWLGDGVLISSGDKWKSRRKMIVPTFHQSILKSFIPVFNDNARNLIKSLEKESDKVFDIHDYMTTTTVDVLLETAMGVRKTRESKESFSYAMAVMNMCNFMHLRHYKFWLMPTIIYWFTKMADEQKKMLKIIHNLAEKATKIKFEDFFERKKKGDVSLYTAAVKDTDENKETKEDKTNFSFGTALTDDLDLDDDDVGSKKRLAFLDYMIEASQMPGSNLTTADIKDEVNTIMFEGHDTTSAASSFALCVLGVHQNIQERCYKELEEIFQGVDRDVTYHDVVQMKYLERVILETLRMYPPVPMIARTIREDVKLGSGDSVLPKDTTVVIGTYMIHRNPKYFPRPLEFNPDNFLPENCQNRHYYSYIPFSAGPRSCIGRKYAMLKLKVLLATIIRNYRITSPVTEKEFQLQGDIILKRADGFHVKIEKRERRLA